MLFLGKHKNSSFLCRIRINFSLHVGISQAVEIAAPSQDVACVNYPLESDVAGDNSEGSWDNAPALSHSPPRLAGNRGRGMLRSRGWILGRSPASIPRLLPGPGWLWSLLQEWQWHENFSDNSTTNLCSPRKNSSSTFPKTFQGGKQLSVSNKGLQHQLSRLYFHFSSPHKFPMCPKAIFCQKGFRW